MNQLILTFLELAKKEGVAEAQRKLLPPERMLNFRGHHEFTVEQRFLMCIQENPETKCWEWVALRRKDEGYEYGCFSMNGRMKRAHRVMWEWINGAIPPRIFICHRCDNPPCCNPDHLFAGTQQQNMDDMHSKGRGKDYRSEDCCTAKLTAEDVVKIRSMVGTNMEIGALFGVHNSTICQIRKRNTWKNV